MADSELFHKPRKSLFDCLAIQYRVICALFLREIHTRYGRENLGFLWIIIEPIVFCIAVTIMWTHYHPGKQHGLAVVGIVVTGYPAMSLWRHCLNRSVSAYKSNDTLLYHRQVTPFDIIAARTCLEIVGTGMAAVLLNLGVIALGYLPLPRDMSLFFLGYTYLIFFCFGTAILISAAAVHIPLIAKVTGVASYLMIPFTGAFIMIAWLPPKYQWMLALSPMANDVEMIRAGQFGITAKTTYDIFYTSWSTGLMLLVGLAMTAPLRRHIPI